MADQTGGNGVAAAAHSPDATAGVSRVDPDHPIATKREIRSWYAIDWSNSTYATVGIGGFLPLLLQTAGMAAADFPAVCGNVSRNATLLSSIFIDSATNVTQAYFVGSTPVSSCGKDSACRSGWCPGLPVNIADCREADGKTLFKLRIAGTDVEPTSFATLAISLSVAVQVVLFLLVSAGADFGATRKKMLLIASYVGAIACVSAAGVTATSWWWGMPVIIISNAAFGITSICYNSYLPLLSRSHPRVVAAAEEERVAAILASPLMLTDGSPAPSPAATGVAAGGGATNPIATPTGSGSGSGDAAANPLRTLPPGTTDAIASAGGVGSGSSSGSGAGSAASLRITAPAVGAATIGPGSATPANAGTGATPLVGDAASPAVALTIARATSAAGNGAVTGTGGRTTPLTALETEALVNDQLSNHGFAWGYVAGIIGIILCVPFAFLLSEIGSYQVAMIIVGIWWAAFMVFPWRTLLPRPGPPLPAGRSLIVQSVVQQWRTVCEARRLPTTWKFLVLWMIFSDGVFLLGTLGGLFANSEVEWGCIPKTIGILLIFFVVPIFALLGNMSYLAVSQRWAVRGKTMLMFSLFCCSLVPAYALLGLASSSIGIRTGIEMLLVAVWYGLHLGAMQAYSRSCFALLIPRGRESAFYSLYELTNRGSSALGPLVVTGIQQATGNLRLGFSFCLVSIAFGSLLLCLDLEKGGRAAAAFVAANVAGAGAPGHGSSSSGGHGGGGDKGKVLHTAAAAGAAGPSGAYGTASSGGSSAGGSTGAPSGSGSGSGGAPSATLALCDGSAHEADAPAAADEGSIAVQLVPFHQSAAAAGRSGRASPASSSSSSASSSAASSSSAVKGLGVLPSFHADTRRDASFTAELASLSGEPITDVQVKRSSSVEADSTAWSGSTGSDGEAAGAAEAARLQRATSLKQRTVPVQYAAGNCGSSGLPGSGRAFAVAVM